MNDLEFVQSCIQGDRQSWNEFVDKYSRLIYNYIHSVSRAKGLLFTQGQIEDLFQEIFLSLVGDDFKKLSSFKAKNGCSLASWLRQVTINSTIDYIRKLKPVFSIDDENEDGLSPKDILADESGLAADMLVMKEKLAHLKKCIEKLDAQDKYFLELYINKGLTLEELKDFLKVSRGAVDMRKSRIIERLKNCFRSKGFMLDF